RIADHIAHSLFGRADHVAGFDGNRISAMNHGGGGSARLVQTVRPDIAVRVCPAAEIERVKLAGREGATRSRGPDEGALANETEKAILALGPGAYVVVAVKYHLGRVGQACLVR